ncbi:ABC-2 type transporter [Thalassoporum mexicanum PCC 7367]|uniref:ABC transporter permease n=1 Tax=Thalassoporum mexicanum TaxID=3457544 RepID=UPI00029FF497|nr:ABC transporter permease [Pseudanabaena sp. PCC 7367]AFY68496.1 ABC-2 type transporter [Pseudanabaena sp. PCC 7367]
MSSVQSIGLDHNSEIYKQFKSQAQKSLWRSIWSGSLTVLWGDWLNLRVRIYQVIASGLISPLIYILAFGFGLGSTIGSSGAFEGNYLEFILPGMVALSSMTISFGGTTFSICGDRLYKKTFEELLIAPIHPLALYLGNMLAGVSRGLLTASSVIAIATIYSGNWRFLHPEFLLLLILNCTVFAGLGVIVGLTVKSLEAVGLTNNFLIVPMSFLGGTFFDPVLLPQPLKSIVYVLPLTHTSVGLRAVVGGGHSPWYGWLVLLAVSAGLGALGARMFAKQRD